MKKIDKGLRFTNYIIDYFVIVLMWMIIALIFNISGNELIVFYLLFFLYYLILESSSGQTLGKLLTNTQVISVDGRKATFFMIFKRSFLRLIPIDAISYLFGTELGFHDVLSSTKLEIKNAMLSKTEES